MTEYYKKENKNEEIIITRIHEDGEIQQWTLEGTNELADLKAALNGDE